MATVALTGCSGSPTSPSSAIGWTIYGKDGTQFCQTGAAQCTVHKGTTGHVSLVVTVPNAVGTNYTLVFNYGSWSPQILPPASVPGLQNIEDNHGTCVIRWAGQGGTASWSYDVQLVDATMPELLLQIQPPDSNWSVRVPLTILP